MSTLSDDTPSEIEAIQLAGLRAMPARRKMELVGQLTLTVRNLALVGLRQRYPNDTPEQHRRRLADLMLGPELAARVYGPPVEVG